MYFSHGFLHHYQNCGLPSEFEIVNRDVSRTDIFC